ncbi:ATP-dependent DNA helicase [Guyanagaster necrorhizus]|uniref:ATP-dependent DNA helicase n=1 Tax=Guyanagaster necrorhizus TaxID=856835 RepID=A0A9P7W1R5_9AGAR|nr:ATP-dependent DNA helicase [Guyanagaster necrorhizus MCA 3950]KAG7450790.1 ATP-dependent DNA helicase [Guyanagaster necrorhizus MCA 3950]
MEKALQVLKNVFRHSSFRLSQEAVIQRLLVDNKNALVLFPTGGGKSLTYQVPALCLDGLTLVISPLIALMKDQVDALRDRGVKAANLDSTLDAEVARVVKHDVIANKIKLLYVAPERLNNEGFLEMMKHVKISLLAVDESHCVSQWGLSFRPDYLKVARFAKEMDVERVLCLTATATPSIARDICEQFCIDPKAGLFDTPIYRPNLSFQVDVADNFAQKIERLVPFLKKRTGPAIIYVTLQKQAQNIASELARRKLDAMVYHAGLPSEERARIQQQFMTSEKGIVCATIAFGMGIDKANIRQVVHLYMPKTLENYSQEVGRAGRDGLPSTCLLFLSAPDIPVLEGFSRGDTCNKTSLELWMQEVALKSPSTDETLDFNHYQQSKSYDMKASILGLCYAHLELQHKYIRAVTPFYEIYDITFRDADGMKQVKTDASPAAKAIRANWQSKASGFQINMVEAAERSGLSRESLAGQISMWEIGQHISTKPSQVRMRYRIVNSFPTELSKISAIAQDIHAGMVQREEEGIRKLQEVIEFATKPECLAHSLATYFGHGDAVPSGRCGHCTFCKTGTGVVFRRGANTTPDSAQVRAILNACPERDDPWLLARMAFGITSPRLTAGRWSTSHPLFGSMEDVDFNALVEAFDAECKKVDYVSLTVTKTTPAPKKRPTSARGRGKTSKRGRYDN